MFSIPSSAIASSMAVPGPATINGSGQTMKSAFSFFEL
jgi:hypothetical protein